MTRDVVIAGGGPNGLMLASELRLAGLRPVVLERLTERGGEVRAEALVGRVLQVLACRGLYPRLSDGAPEPVRTPMFNFGGLPLDLRPLGDDNPLYLLRIRQPQLERHLEDRAHELDVEIRRGHEVLGFAQDDHGVRVDVRGPDGDYQIEAQYLAGCDGAHSTVRKHLGVAFPDFGDQDIVSRTADVVLPESVLRGERVPTDILQQTSWLEVPGVGRVPFGYHRNARGAYALGSFTPGVHILGTWEWRRSEVDPEVPMTVAELRESMARVIGGELPMRPPDGPGPHRLFRLIGDSRVAERYRVGRVVLVGDAAHVHAAINGPGLNLGLQDAVNLAWKLAGCVQGWAPAGLLDTYHSERHYAAERVVMQTQAQGAFMAPGANVTSLRELFTELLANTGTLRAIADVMAGSDLQYDMPAAGDDPHPLLGRWAPDFALTTADGATRLAELMNTPRPFLLDLTGDAAFAEAAAGWKDRVDVVVAGCPDPPAAGLLIRPDGYVAWAARTAADAQRLPDALAAWFGPGAG